MAKINKVDRGTERDRKETRNNKQHIAGDRHRNRNKRQDVIGSVSSNTVSGSVKAAKIAQKVGSDSLRHSRDMARNTDSTGEQDAVDRYEGLLIGATEDVSSVVSRSVQGATERIRKRTTDIKNTRDIRSNVRVIRRADKTARTSEKATQTVRKTANEAAKQAVITTEKISQAKRTEQLARKSSEWVNKIVKGIIEGVKQLCAMLAGISVPLLLILIIASLVAAIAASAFGIFFTSDGAAGEDTRTLQSVVLEINQEYLDAIETIKTDNPHDDLTIEGFQAAWPDILSVYAVYVTTSAEGATDVVHLTDDNITALRNIFWAMNTISYTTEDITETVQVPLLEENGDQQVDEDGNLLYTEKSITTTILHITVSHLSAVEESANLGFSDTQLAQMSELLDVRYVTLWVQILRVVGLGTNEFVNLALSQLGNEGGEKFWRWAGRDERCPWCALFVSWCADQTGLMASGQIPYFSFVTDGVAWFQENDKWIDGSEVDSSNYEQIVYPGMLIFFDWTSDGVPDHVGIITNVSSGYVYTVEGNNGDAVVESLYDADSECLYGFGVVGGIATSIT